MRVARLSQMVFAATFIALGILGLIKAGFVGVWEPVPKGVPAREALPYLCAVVSLASGIGLLWQRVAIVAARVLLAYVLVWFLLLRVPSLFRGIEVQYWWPAAQTATVAAAAWVLYVGFAAEWDRRRLAFATGASGLRIARVLYGLALIPFGVAHFVYLNETATLVPGWLPWHVGWAYFTGGALIAAGIAILLGVYARLAAALSAVEMGALTLLVWVPIIAMGSRDAFQQSEAAISWALTVCAWVVADSYRSSPWLAVGSLGRG
jgi:uncharacterized membrane protein